MLLHCIMHIFCNSFTCIKRKNVNLKIIYYQHSKSIKICKLQLWFTSSSKISNWTEVFIYTAATAKSLQSCPTLCDPIDGCPPGSPVPGILQARTLEWVAISFSNAWKWKVKVKSLSRVILITFKNQILDVLEFLHLYERGFWNFPISEI